jgi:single-strand DNA-binding protein
MTDLNNVTLICRVTQEIGEKDFGYISTGTAKLQLHVANNESRKKGENWEDETSYFDITVWGKPAENLKAKIRKGLLVAVSGRLKQDRWEKDGQKKSKIYINADSVQILEKVEKAQGTAPAESNDGFPEDFPFN